MYLHHFMKKRHENHCRWWYSSRLDSRNITKRKLNQCLVFFHFVLHVSSASQSCLSRNLFSLLFSCSREKRRGNGWESFSRWFFNLKRLFLSFFGPTEQEGRKECYQHISMKCIMTRQANMGHTLSADKLLTWAVMDSLDSWKWTCVVRDRCMLAFIPTTQGFTTELDSRDAWLLQSKCHRQNRV